MEFVAVPYPSLRTAGSGRNAEAELTVRLESDATLLKGNNKYKGLDKRRLISDFEATGVEVMTMMTSDAKRLLKQVVGTQYASLDELRAMGHPYAIAALAEGASRQAPPMPPGYINKQGGGFAASFTWELPRKRGNQILVEVQSDDPDLEQMLINGTPTMVARPFRALFMALVRDRIMNRMGNQFRRALRMRLVLSR